MPIPAMTIFCSLMFFRVERIYEDIQGSIANRSIHNDIVLNKLSLVIQKVTALMGILVCVFCFNFVGLFIENQLMLY